VEGEGGGSGGGEGAGAFGRRKEEAEEDPARELGLGRVLDVRS